MAMRRGWNPHRITLTERLAYPIGKDERKVRAIYRQHPGLLPQQRPLIVTTFKKQPTKKEKWEFVVPQKLFVGMEMSHSAGGKGKITKIDRSKVWINFDPRHGDNPFPGDQICRSCLIVFPSAPIKELHCSKGHKKDYPYVAVKARKETKKVEYEEVRSERRTAVQYDKDENRFFVQTEE